MQEGQPEEAQSPTCPQCGASLPVDIAHASVRCQHCNAEVTIDEGLRRAMLAYVGDVAGAVRQELEARFEAAFYKQNEKATNLIVFGTVGIACSFVGVFMAWVITHQESGGIPLVFFVFVIGAWAGSLGAFARGWAVMHDIPSLSSLAGLRVARCSGCGAMRAFGAGEAAVACTACSSRLWVPFELASSLLGEAKTHAKASAEVRDQSLGAAVSAGDRVVGTAVAIVVVFAFVLVFAVLGFAMLGAPPGGEVSGRTVWLSVLGSFVLAIAHLWRSTAGAMRKRAEKDDLIARAAARAVGLAKGP